MADGLEAGWADPGRNANGRRKRHYFPRRGSCSLCGKVGHYLGPREKGGDGSADDCGTCRRMLNDGETKEQAKL
jgi:hypothetical protein